MLQGMETEGCAQFFTHPLRVIVTALNENASSQAPAMSLVSPDDPVMCLHSKQI